MSSRSPYASRLSTFRAPGWGTLAILPPCRWRNATSRKLVPFSHHSASRIFIRQPGHIPSPVVTQDGDLQFDGGEKRTGLRSWSRPQLQGSTSSWLGQGVRRAGALPPARVGWPPPLPASSGGNHPPALRGRRPPAMPGKANCCYPARMQHSVLLLAFVARTGARTCRCALERPALTGVALVERRMPPSMLTWWQLEEASPPSRPLAPPTDRPPALLALISSSRPLSGDANESLPVSASVLGSWLLLQRSLASRPELVAPQAPRCGGCSYPRGQNRSSVCNGTLSAGVLFIVAVGA
jgi:hypothetical protein